MTVPAGTGTAPVLLHWVWRASDLLALSKSLAIEGFLAGSWFMPYSLRVHPTVPQTDDIVPKYKKVYMIRLMTGNIILNQWLSSQLWAACNENVAENRHYRNICSLNVLKFE